MIKFKLRNQCNFTLSPNVPRLTDFKVYVYKIKYFLHPKGLKLKHLSKTLVVIAQIEVPLILRRHPFARHCQRVSDNPLSQPQVVGKNCIYDVPV